MQGSRIVVVPLTWSGSFLRNNRLQDDKEKVDRLLHLTEISLTCSEEEFFIIAFLFLESNVAFPSVWLTDIKLVLRIFHLYNNYFLFHHRPKVQKDENGPLVLVKGFRANLEVCQWFLRRVPGWQQKLIFSAIDPRCYAAYAQARLRYAIQEPLLEPGMSILTVDYAMIRSKRVHGLIYPTRINEPHVLNSTVMNFIYDYAKRYTLAAPGIPAICKPLRRVGVIVEEVRMAKTEALMDRLGWGNDNKENDSGTTYALVGTRWTNGGCNDEMFFKECATTYNTVVEAVAKIKCCDQLNDFYRVSIAGIGCDCGACMPLYDVLQHEEVPVHNIPTNIDYSILESPEFLADLKFLQNSDFCNLIRPGIIDVETGPKVTEGRAKILFDHLDEGNKTVLEHKAKGSNIMDAFHNRSMVVEVDEDLLLNEPMDDEVEIIAPESVFHMYIAVDEMVAIDFEPSVYDKINMDPHIASDSNKEVKTKSGTYLKPPTFKKQQDIMITAGIDFKGVQFEDNMYDEEEPWLNEGNFDDEVEDEIIKRIECKVVRSAFEVSSFPHGALAAWLDSDQVDRFYYTMFSSEWSKPPAPVYKDRSQNVTTLFGGSSLKLVSSNMARLVVQKGKVGVIINDVGEKSNTSKVRGGLAYASGARRAEMVDYIPLYRVDRRVRFLSHNLLLLDGLVDGGTFILKTYETWSRYVGDKLFSIFKNFLVVKFIRTRYTKGASREVYIVGRGYKIGKVSYGAWNAALYRFNTMVLFRLMYALRFAESFYPQYLANVTNTVGDRSRIRMKVCLNST